MPQPTNPIYRWFNMMLVNADFLVFRLLLQHKKKKISLEENVITPQTVQASRKSPSSTIKEGEKKKNTVVGGVLSRRGGRSIVL